MFLTRRILQNQAASDGGATGASGGTQGAPNAGTSNDPLFGGTAGANGSQTGQNGGSNGGNSQPPAGEKPAVGTPTGTPVEIPANWKDALPPELKDAPWMKNVADVPTLVKNYENAQKMIGADKIPVPAKGASKEEWQAVFRKLGVPEKLDEYKFDLDPKVKVDPEFLTGFKTKAHALGMLPDQAKEVVGWFSEVNEKAWETMNKQAEQKSTEEIRALQSEWGEAFTQNIDAAKVVIKEFTDEATAKALRDAGLGRNPAFLKFLHSVSKTMAEDKFRGGPGGQSGSAITPAEALAKINEVKADKAHPYWNADHAGHLAAKKEYTQLFQMAFPPKKENLP
jgi:hypothetical protein